MERRALLSTIGLAPLAVVAAAPTSRPRAAYFPNVVLQTHDGRKVRFYDDVVSRGTVVFNFMYANCQGTCPGQTANLVEVQRLLGERVGRDIFMYSLTLDPERDTPASLKAYAVSHHVQPGWTFLTGKKRDLELLRRKLGYWDPDPKVDQDRTKHIGLVRYGVESLDRWAACPALSNPKQIVRAILSLRGASA